MYHLSGWLHGIYKLAFCYTAQRYRLGTGDVGTLNAKDTNKGTVLALLGMFCAILAGSSKASISLHFATTIKGMGDVGDLNVKDTIKKTVLAFLSIMHTQPARAPAPVEVANLERIFEHPGAFRDPRSLLGHSTIGSSFLEILNGPIPLRLPELIKDEPYLLWFDCLCPLQQESLLLKASFAYISASKTGTILRIN